MNHRATVLALVCTALDLYPLTKVSAKNCEMKVDGRCLCGYLTYEAEVDADAVIICNCLDGVDKLTLVGREMVVQMSNIMPPLSQRSIPPWPRL